MKYAIYFVWNDGFSDSVIAASREERDLYIKDLINRKEFKDISYCKIYKSGEYGKRINMSD